MQAISLAISLMPLVFPVVRILQNGGESWSARVPLDPLFATGSISSKREGRPGGRPRIGCPAATGLFSVETIFSLLSDLNDQAISLRYQIPRRRAVSTWPHLRRSTSDRPRDYRWAVGADVCPGASRCVCPSRGRRNPIVPVFLRKSISTRTERYAADCFAPTRCRTARFRRRSSAAQTAACW